MGPLPPVRRDETTRHLSRAGTVWLAAAGMSLVAVCYGLARFAYGLFVPVFREEFGLDAATAGAIASASYVAYCVGILAATAATPRLGARAVAVLAGCLATLGTAAVAVASGPAVLALGVMAAGSSTGVASPPLAQAIAHRVDPASRDRIQAIVNAGTGLGVMVSGPVALVAQGQWRAAWLVFALLSAVVTVWVARVVPVVKGLGAPAGSEPAPEGVRPGTARVPVGAWRLGCAAAVMGAASAATWTFGQDLLTASGGHGQATSVLAWIVLGACGLLGAAAGVMTERFGMGLAWIFCMLAMAGATAVLGLVPHLLGAALVASGVFGAAYIALTGLVLVWSTRVFERAPAVGVGASFLLIAAGQAAAAPVWGWVADWSTMTIAFVVAACMAVVGCLVGPSRPVGRAS